MTAIIYLKMDVLLNVFLNLSSTAQLLDRQERPTVHLFVGMA